MDRIALRIDPEQPYQVQTITLAPDGKTMTLRLELRYLVYTEKWYLSIWNASENVCLLTHIPIVSSEEILNDLLGVFQYLEIGSIACLPSTVQLYGQDPVLDNMDQYEIQWGDSLG